MPELPEVETIRRQLAPLLEGRELIELSVLDPRWCAPLRPVRLRGALVGRRLLQMGRRGKYLVWRFEGGAHLLVHLRMTGTLLWDPPAPVAHARVRARFGGQEPSGAGARKATGRAIAPATAELVLVDPRRFSTGELLQGEDAVESFFAARLGLEPLDPSFTVEYLRAQARGRRAPVKAFLLDQRRVAGVGNIYADEALYRAGIHPLRAVGKLERGDHERLREALVAALDAGIDARGASIDDYRHIDGARGSFQDQFLVHRRAGEPCGRCGSVIVKLRAAGRGTYVCERCQPAPRRRRAPAATAAAATVTARRSPTSRLGAS